ncbi:MAG: DUF3105 domain-containing protein [Myxococcaceae bacterium]
MRPFAAGFTVLLLAACGAKTSGSVETLDASCTVTVQAVPIEPSPHVEASTPIEWSSNPPSSGAHFGAWAAFKEFTTPVPRGYYVHDLEHGAVVLLYNCALAADGGCEALVQGLRDASDALPDDPLCAGVAGVRVRTVITPDPLITTPLAAAAWGYTYSAACLDPATLQAFAKEHYAHAAENECANGLLP